MELNSIPINGNNTGFVQPPYFYTPYAQCTKIVRKPTIAGFQGLTSKGREWEGEIRGNGEWKGVRRKGEKLAPLDPPSSR